MVLFFLAPHLAPQYRSLEYSQRIQNADLYHMQLWFLILDNHYSIEMVTNPRKRFARQPLDGPGSQYFSKTVMGHREISTFQMKWVTCSYFKYSKLKYSNSNYYRFLNNILNLIIILY